jgi:hypothetical protein
MDAHLSRAASADITLGLGGIASLWWLPSLAETHEVAATIAAVGGAAMVLGRGAQLAWRGVRWVRARWRA